MEDIGNTPGTFFKVVEQTKRMRYVSFSRICVYLDILKEIPDNIKLSWHDEEWIQPIDYEHIPSDAVGAMNTATSSDNAN